MNSLTKIAALTAALLAVPVASYAQSNQQPVTRAQVQAELVQAEQAGYSPEQGYYYPANAQRAMQAVSGGAPQALTRAQVREELAQTEKAGFRPTDGYYYPANAQQAEQVIAAGQNNGTTAFGPNSNGTSQSGK